MVAVETAVCGWCAKAFERDVNGRPAKTYCCGKCRRSAQKARRQVGYRHPKAYKRIVLICSGLVNGHCRWRVHAEQLRLFR